LAADQKKTTRRSAHLVFEDESGFFLNPLVRRTWAVAGQTPVFHQRGRWRQHLSAVGAVTISPRRRRLGLLLQLHPDQSVNQDRVIEFLRQLLRQLRGHIVLVWDRLAAHRGAKVRKFLQKHPRLHIEFLPAYAPELNPVEYLWSWLKTNPLANRCSPDLDQLTDDILNGSQPLFNNQHLLRGFVQGTELPIRIPCS
jgi:transposase